MPRPRKELVSLADTPYYHVVSRCVRRTFLCGFDEETQISYEHRREWIEVRIRLLASVFAVEVCAYAVMSNHYHIVLKLEPRQAEQWTDDDVLKRWQILYRGTLLVQRYALGEQLNAIEYQQVTETLAQYRSRLTDLSWFMKCLNEPIARQANKEDGCTGHFWESRFKSQALHTDAALLACMAYVDLNPVRAGMAESPEASDYTSIKERILPTNDNELQSRSNDFSIQVKPLAGFVGNADTNESATIPCRFEEYLQLVDWTGRSIRNDKRSVISTHLPPILTRLGIKREKWLRASTQFEARRDPMKSRVTLRQTSG